MQATDAAHECFARLQAAQRAVSSDEWREIEQEAERERVAARIKRRLPKVY